MNAPTADALPALCLIAMPGRRRRTLELCQEVEKRGYAGIYVPSPTGNMSMCEALSWQTQTIPFATSIVPIYQRTMTGEPSDEVSANVSEITKRELIAVTPLLALIIALGVFPQVALKVINPTVATAQQYVSVTDPVTGGSGS